MSEKENQLPKPPRTPFGRRHGDEDEGGLPHQLMADRMAMAMAEGRLDEFMRENLPDNEQTRQLAMMMMSMTGMMPPTGFPAPDRQSGTQASPDRSEEGEDAAREAGVPADVIEAVRSGDMHQLMDLLKREHQKRTGSEIPVPQSTAEAGFNAAPTGIEKETLDQLLAISAANSVTLDWLIMRAIKVYIEEYRKTGKL